LRIFGHFCLLVCGSMMIIIANRPGSGRELTGGHSWSLVTIGYKDNIFKYDKKGRASP
jgi:hypothetical protein